MVQGYREMLEWLGKVIGKSNFLNLEDFLITCYIVEVSSPLVDDSSTAVLWESPSIYIKIYTTFLS